MHEKLKKTAVQVYLKLLNVVCLSIYGHFCNFSNYIALSICFMKLWATNNKPMVTGTTLKTCWKSCKTSTSCTKVANIANTLISYTICLYNTMTSIEAQLVKGQGQEIIARNLTLHFHVCPHHVGYWGHIFMFFCTIKCILLILWSKPQNDVTNTYSLTGCPKASLLTKTPQNATDSSIMTFNVVYIAFYQQQC